MKIKNQKSKIKNLGVVLSLFLTFITYNLLLITPARADSVIDNGINFLKSKQDASGRITTGFSAPSQWSAIALTANGIDISNVKNPTNSLKDFLLSDVPSEPSAATDWETRILAIVAVGGNPANFGGTNYVSHLETFYNSNQIGDICSLNDDIFGLLALVSSGPLSNTQIKQDTLNFLISKQDPTDGGFGFSAPGCEWYSTSADMTGAAVQALVAAKDNGVTNEGLEDAINKAKNYLLSNQNSDGGFGYYGSTDTDTTGWVLMAFNSLGMKDSVQAVNARNWLVSQQSATDGGFLAFDYGSNTFVSNSSTTAQAIIGLSNKTWILKIFNPTEATNTNTSSTSQPTPTPSSVSSSSSNSSTPTTTPTPTPKITLTPSPTQKAQGSVISNSVPENPTPKTEEPEVLGQSEEKVKPEIEDKQMLIKNLSSGFFPLLFGFGLYIVVRFWERRWKK